MNQKLVKAHKRVNEKRARPGDIERISRSLQIKTTQPKPLVCRMRKAKDPIKPTWPHTVNQSEQSRPVIIARPLRHIHERRPDFKDAQGKFAGHTPHYQQALIAANRGMGHVVRHLAQTA